jgi:thiosulfate dehydrogenase [quinone] large subunit
MLIDTLRKYSADPRITGVFWLLVRFLLAYQWITSGWEKLTSPAWVGSQAPQALHKFLTASLEKTSGPQPAVFGWYAWWIQNVGLPNEAWYSYLVSFGEFLVGIALLVGLFTKWAAFLGAAMNLNYIFAGSASANGYMLAAETALVFGGLGVSYYALDRWILPALGHLLTRGQRPMAPAPSPPLLAGMGPQRRSTDPQPGSAKAGR